MTEDKKKNPKCFTDTYTTPVFMRGALMCIGGFGQPRCKFLIKCIEQYRGIVPDKSIDKFINKLKKCQ